MSTSLKDRVAARRAAEASSQTTAPPPPVANSAVVAATAGVNVPSKPRNANTAKQPFEKVTSTVVLNGPDVDIMDNLDLWVKKSRIRIGRKIGLTAYARAGLRLLHDLTKTDPVAAEGLIRATADKE